jgi:protein-S-isoprenylcysteine O-methyltransferase Ste14
MAAAALVLYGVSLMITFGVRVALQLRRTGSTGLHGLSPGAGPWEWLAGGMFIAGLLMGGAAPILALLGILEPIPALDGAVGHGVGLALAVGGIALTFSAQLAMGDSWRVGVDPEERTELVTAGPFKLVRNPIYSAMLPTVLGLVLMAPSALAVAAIVTLFIGLELQVRLVEEPYLLRVHGDAYAAYAARVGRFMPRLGLLHAAPSQVVAVALLGIALGAALFAPAGAAALDSDLKGFAVFKLEASHGYSILGFASSERIDGRGDIGLIVYRRGSAVSYSAPAIVTPTRLEADLGALGEIDADIAPSSKKKKLRSRCGGRVRTVQPALYRGRFEFHGEEGYTEAVATRATEDVQFLLDIVCPGGGGGEESGAGLPGARLHAVFRHGDRRLALQLNKNRPGKATVFSASLAERRGEIRIERSVSGRQPARVFEYDPLLRAATVEPLAPFSGVAHFHRGAVAANRWTGNLSLDFPGESDVPLAGSGFVAHLVHAHMS